MFKKILLVLCLLVLCVTVSSGGITDKLKSVIARKNVAGGTTDSTADPNCMGAWFTNGGLSANGDDEIDRSGEGETLTETGGDIPNSATVPGGYSGTSRDFEDGDTEGLVHADGGSTDISGADQALTLAAWIKYEANPDSDDAIINKYYVVGNERQYKISFRNSDSAVVGYISNDGTAFSKAIGGTDINDTNWHHVALVYNDIDIRIYLDGSLDSNGADNPKAHTTGIYNGTAQFNVGSNVDASAEYFDGLIDEVIVFDRALSAAEILYIYNNGIDGTKGGND
ncbi:LamG domain-containing protein [Candidatus Pacearchaeota archaeon]|nr:LamG domain-containing protein [Candidatus Pacearchaeota archaeon]